MKTQLLAVFSVLAVLFSAASCEQHKWSSTKELFSHGEAGHDHEHKEDKKEHAGGDHSHGEKKEEKH